MDIKKNVTRTVDNVYGSDGTWQQVLNFFNIQHVIDK